MVRNIINKKNYKNMSSFLEFQCSYKFILLIFWKNKILRCLSDVHNKMYFYQKSEKEENNSRCQNVIKPFAAVEKSE